MGRIASWAVQECEELAVELVPTRFRFQMRGPRQGPPPHEAQHPCLDAPSILRDTGGQSTLLADGKLRVEGQKRATEYYPADGSGSAKTTRAAKGSGVKVKRGRGRPKKKA